MPSALFCFFFWHFAAYSAFARSLIGTDFQARLDYVACLRDFVFLRMTALNVRSTLICAGDSLHTRIIILFLRSASEGFGVILSVLRFGFLGSSTPGLQGVHAVSVFLCCVC